MKNKPVIVSMHYESVAEYNTVFVWLRENGIKYVHNAEKSLALNTPVRIALSDSDAVALKLRFGL